jgi:hypothetical protein
LSDTGGLAFCESGDTDGEHGTLTGFVGGRYPGEPPLLSVHVHPFEAGHTHEKREEPLLDELTFNTDYIFIPGYTA